MPLHVAIVGAGPAGMAAAIEARRRGSTVTLLDEMARPGGQIFRQSAIDSELRVGLPGELKRKTELLSRFSAIVDQIDYRKNHTAYALFEGPELHISDDNSSEVLKPDVVVLTTGVCERGVPFPGWTLPGVVFAGGAQTLLKSQGVKIGERVVIAGSGPLPIAVAAQLTKAGVHVVAVAMLHPMRNLLIHVYALWRGRRVVAEGLSYLNILRQHDVLTLSRCVPLRADGGDHIDSVQIAQHDGTGRPVPGTERRIGCDVLALNYGFTVNSELAAMAGAELTYRAEQGGWIPTTDRFCRTSCPGVMVAGDAGGLRGAWVAQIEGRIAGAVASRYYDDKAVSNLDRELQQSFKERSRHESFQRAVQQFLRLPPGVWSWADEKTIVCRCECVTQNQIQKAIDDGHTSLNAIKRNTRAGMGWCGGRMCMQNVAAQAHGGKLPADLQPMTPRPVARPISMQALSSQTIP